MVQRLYLQKKACPTEYIYLVEMRFPEQMNASWSVRLRLHQIPFSLRTLRSFSHGFIMYYYITKQLRVSWKTVQNGNLGLKQIAISGYYSSSFCSLHKLCHSNL